MNVLSLRDDRGYIRQKLNSPKPYMKYITLVTVGVAHLGLLYLLWDVQTELPMEISTPENAIQIRFIQLKKTEVVQDNKTLSVQASAPQPPAVPASSTVVQPSKTDQPSQITSTVSKKTAVMQSNTEPRPVVAKRTDPVLQQPAHTSQNMPTTESQVVRSNTTASHTNPSSQLEGSGAEKPSGGAERQAQQQEQLTTASTASSPVPVSRVDVLSLGKFNYDDRELHQQQRLLILTIQIDHKGLPITLWVKQSSGIPSLDERALKAMKKSKFKPHKINGEPVAVVVDFPIQLKLSRNR